jgi:RND family efflux transporter MFP subunit
MSEEQIPKDLPTVKTRHIAIIAFVGVVLLGGLFLVGFIPHRNRVAQAEEIAREQDDRPKVDVVQPRRAESRGELQLPGDARAFQDTSIYPRATGYLKRLLVDIGDRVTEGQLLAEIDAPEVTAQLDEAKAAVEQSKANVTKAQTDLAFAGTTYDRYQSLSKTGAVTPQDVDEKLAAVNQSRSALDAAKANVTAAQAAVQRLSELQSFQKITAPFAGVITARNYDVGALLQANNTGKEMFRLEQTDTLRVFVNIPQTYATSIKNGQAATLEVRNFPGRQFTGKVTRAAGALDPSTRTLRMQVDFPNPDGTLIAGMYGQVRFQLADAQPPLLVPTGAMIFEADGTKVALVENNHVRFQKVDVGRDLGTELEVTNGLNGDEQVIANPGARLADGVEVQVVDTPTPPQVPPRDKTQTASK